MPLYFRQSQLRLPALFEIGVDLFDCAVIVKFARLGNIRGLDQLRARKNFLPQDIFEITDMSNILVLLTVTTELA